MGKGRGRAVVSHPGAEDRTDALKHLIIQMTSGVVGGRLMVFSQTRTTANVNSLRYINGCF